jgi:hypothetical protein
VPDPEPVLEESEDAQEIPLKGGLITSVVRVGNTVRRQIGPWSPAIHALLRHFEALGVEGVPRLLGVDQRGREILGYIEGAVPTGADPELVTDEALVDVGQLIRRLHDATATFTLPEGVAWHYRSYGGPEPHVICHHDLSPRNTVFRDGRAVAFIDWDFASPSAPILDVVRAAWQFVPLAHPTNARAQGWREPPNYCRRTRILVDAYGLLLSERAGFALKACERIEGSASVIESLAAAGNPPFVRLVESGVVRAIRADQAWIREHAAEIDAALTE